MQGARDSQGGQLETKLRVSNCALLTACHTSAGAGGRGSLENATRRDELAVDVPPAGAEAALCTVLPKPASPGGGRPGLAPQVPVRFMSESSDHCHHHLVLNTCFVPDLSRTTFPASARRYCYSHFTCAFTVTQRG